MTLAQSCSMYVYTPSLSSRTRMDGCLDLSRDSPCRGSGRAESSSWCFPCHPCSNSKRWVNSNKQLAPRTYLAFILTYDTSQSVSFYVYPSWLTFRPLFLFPFPIFRMPPQPLSETVTYSSSVYSYLKGTIVASTGLAILLSALLYFKQSELIYPRSLPSGARTVVPTPDEFGIDDWETVKLQTPDGETLSCYLLRTSKRPQTGATVLFMHGNAGNIGHRLPIARVFSEQMGCNVFILSYRGYGLSTGRPSEKGLMIDAKTALTYLLNNDSTRKTKIFVYGQSLGGALAIQLVARNQDKVQGLILENTFRSIRTLIPTVFPPARYLARLCHQIWPSEKTLPEIVGVPVLFLSGLKDELVPPSHMKTLYDVCTSKLKVWKELPNGTHNDTCGEENYFEYIDEFIRDALSNEKLAAQSGANINAIRK